MSRPGFYDDAELSKKVFDEVGDLKAGQLEVVGVSQLFSHQKLLSKSRVQELRCNDYFSFI